MCADSIGDSETIGLMASPVAGHRHRARSRCIDLSDVERRLAIGRRLRTIRLASGLTQAELSAGLGTKAWISALENGLVYPSLPSLYRLAERLGVDVTSFLVDSAVDPAIEARAEARRALDGLRREMRHAERLVVELDTLVDRPRPDGAHDGGRSG